jgi:hypothetical protein
MAQTQTQVQNQQTINLENWIEKLNLDPEIIWKIAYKEAKVKTRIGDICCTLDSMCPGHTSVFITIEAMVNKMRPAELLKHCIVCKTEARVIFDQLRLIECVEVRPDGYLFAIRRRDGTICLIYEDLDTAFEDINKLLSEQYHLAIDEGEFGAFERLVYERVSTCTCR